MIGFTFSALLSDAGGRPIREFTASVSAPRKLNDGRYECRVECSEADMSRRIISAYSELAYNRALSRVRYILIDRKQGVCDHQGRALWFDPPLRYPDAHAGFNGPIRGRWRSCFPPVSFVGTLVASDGSRRPYAIRIGGAIRTHWCHRFSSSLFFTDCFAKLRFAGDWPDEAYSYAFRMARKELEFWGGNFVDAVGNPITVTAPLLPQDAVSC